MPVHIVLTHSQNSFKCLVHLNNAVDFPYEPETGHKSNGTGQQEEQKHHNRRVAKVQERRRGILDRQFCRKIVATVDEQIHCRETRCEK